MLSIGSTVLFWSLGSAYHLWSPSQCSYPALHWGGRIPPSTGAENSQMLSAISQKFTFNTLVFVSQGKWSSKSPPKCPSECLPRITHVPENGYSWRVHPAASWSSLTAGCLTPLCAARSVTCALLCCRHRGNLTLWHFRQGRVTSEFGHGWKESPIVWHINHDAICLAPLNIHLSGDGSQESSLFVHVLPNTLYTAKYLRQKKIRLTL